MEKLTREINKFVDERNWKQFHNPKDLALSISVESAELLENFQWKSNDEALKENFENIKDELADVLIYSIMLSENLGVNIEDIINNKLNKNRNKYPVEKAKDNKKKYTEY